jgi:hypothetical protein
LQLLICKCRIFGSEDFLLKYILEDGSRDGHTERLPECPEEIVYSAGEGQVSSQGGGLRGKTLRTIKHTKTSTRNEGEEDLR